LTTDLTNSHNALQQACVRSGDTWIPPNDDFGGAQRISWRWPGHGTADGHECNIGLSGDAMVFNGVWRKQDERGYGYLHLDNVVLVDESSFDRAWAVLTGMAHNRCPH
jgi:hypothetical protein